MKNQHVDVDNARLEDQKQVMRDILAADHCPFCEENLKTYHKAPILKEGKYWTLTENQWPYDHTKHHFLLIYKQHVTNLSGADAEAGRELFELIQWLEQTYDIPGGGLAMRFGDTDYSAGTVAHLHAQLLVPQINDEDFEPVKVKLGKAKHLRE